MKIMNFVCFAIAMAALSGAPAQAAAPKLAVFEIELDDFSAGGPIAGESAEETARLRRMSALARQLLAASGLFEVVDGAASSLPEARDHWLRKCNGCDADAARALGAEYSFVAFYRKISIMEQNLQFLIRDARTGEVVNFSQTDLRNETDESWSRALKYLIRYALVEPERAKRSVAAAQ